ncbi:radical SAM protein [Nonomuraea turkmeniaca]|uniref:Radical SAM protein n=1 Tax=Nonomuraea turkmeniaca TaxID=103838 RepID=A0A5S4F507_9ACTN|nr:radical SAM protein [Nonomuraea turkmeniaca]TMR11261.1 radical SAM protein [Nonomuraea turkmeniaca]
MRFTERVPREKFERPPLAVVPQYFGCTVFDRRTSRYLPFDQDTTRLLTDLIDQPFPSIRSEWAQREPSELVGALDRFFDHFDELGFFTLDQRLAGELLDVEPHPEHLTGPLAVHLEIVASCNLTCTHCFAGDLPRRERRLTLDELDRLFADMAAVGAFRLGLTGGEPLLRKDLFDIIDLATGHGLHPCVTTNGLLIDKDVARAFGERDLVWLNVSLEGATAESNDRVRGAGTFERVLDRLAVLREHARFTLAFTIMSTNAGEVEECAALAERVGASTAVFRPLYPAGTALGHLDLMPTYDQYTEALDRLAGAAPVLRHIDPFSPRLREERQSVVHQNLGCGAGNLVCSISVSGEINPCSFLGSAYVAGNIREHRLADLWHRSEGFTSIRTLPGGTCGEADGFSGGCRARALAFNGSIDAADPWLAAPQRRHPLLTLYVIGDDRHG